MGFYHLVVSFFLLSSSLCNDAAGAVVHNNRCKAAEREALLLFKRSRVVDHDGTFSSWVGTDCCGNWSGVACDDQTGHVVGLDVPYSQAEISQEGLVPPQIGNLTHLQSLDLTGFRIEGGWIASLSSLKDLRLRWTDLQRAPDLIDNLNVLPFISEIYISECSGFSIPESLEHVNFSRLSSLTLQGSLNRSMPSWLFNITSLQVLNMRGSNLSGSIPSAIGNLHNLDALILDANELSGSIPEVIGGLHHLYILSLGRNKLTGSIPWSLRNLTLLSVFDLSSNGLNGSMPGFIADFTNLDWLALSGNKLRGALTGNYFNNLPKLSTLFLSGNPLEIRFAPDWNPPFQLVRLALSSCNVGPSFPRWIQKQTGLSYLFLSNSGISGILPTWLWDLSGINFMDLSSNNLSGTIPSKLLHMPSISSLILANNHIEGPLPRFKKANYLRMLLLSNNLFSGRIPISYCKLESLDVLDLSMNHLSGSLPRCLQRWDSLSVLNLASNELDSSIEGAFGSSCDLLVVALSDNSFSGGFPSFLRRCNNLTVLDIGQNNFSGNLPAWIVTSHPMLSVLIVRSNKMYGELPQELHLLSKLQILDLSDNNFSGSIPRGFWNFTAMKDPSPFNSHTKTYGSAKFFAVAYNYSASIITKGQMGGYSLSVLALMTVIDLSSNELSGEIPREVNNLLGLNSLNLSWNHLTGIIPESIGALKNVESLDLSYNNLHGKIPHSMLGMAFLSKLNLSCNNLWGEIPSGSQFSTFNSFSYIGNAGLCGKPLLKLCDGGGNPNEVRMHNMHDDKDSIAFVYLSMAFGFIFGFWTFCGILLFNRRWRCTYFEVIDNTLDKIYEATKRRYSHYKGNSICSPSLNVCV